MPTTLIRNTSQVVTMASGGRPKRGAALGDPGVIDGGEVLIRDGVDRGGRRLGGRLGSPARRARRRRGHRCRGRRRPAGLRRPAHPSDLRRLAPGRVGGPARRGPLVHRADQGGRRRDEHGPPDARDARRRARVADPGPPRADGVVGRHDGRGEERLRALDRGGAASPAACSRRRPVVRRSAWCRPPCRRIFPPLDDAGAGVTKDATSTRSCDRSSRPSPPRAWPPASTSSSIALPTRPTTCGALADACRAAGLAIRLHADQMANDEGAALAAEVGALSVDHVGHISAAGIAALAASETVAVLIPGSLFFVPGEQTPADPRADRCRRRDRALDGLHAGHLADRVDAARDLAGVRAAEADRRRGDRGRHDQRRVRPRPGRGPRIDRARQAGRPPDPRGARLPRAARIASARTSSAGSSSAGARCWSGPPVGPLALRVDPRDSHVRCTRTDPLSRSGTRSRGSTRDRRSSRQGQSWRPIRRFHWAHQRRPFRLLGAPEPCTCGANGAVADIVHGYDQPPPEEPQRIVR